jgi:hypothetical protein
MENRKITKGGNMKDKQKVLTGAIPWSRPDFLDACRYAKDHKGYDGNTHEIALDHILEKYSGDDGAAHAIRFIKIIKFVRNHFDELNKAKLVTRKSGDMVITDSLLDALCRIDYSAMVLNENDILEYSFDIKDVFMWVKLAEHKAKEGNA